ncbi:MAG: single-stranded DNA-binding protein [Victivallaceae bacterium]|nr:single-stranded DNA-binding protein [Victivallaceae bacterium]
MASLNKVLIMGNLTRDPEVRHTPGGSAVCELGLALNRKYMSNNQEQEEVCFVDVTVWGKQAESCGRYLEKGAPVFIEGRLKLDQWQDKNSGTGRSKLGVVAERVQFMPRGGERRDHGDSGGGQQGEYNAQNNAGGAYNQGNNNAPQSGQGYYTPPQQAASVAQPQQAASVAQPQQAASAAPPQNNSQSQPPQMPDGAFDVGKGSQGAEDDIPF